jgi:dipeptidase
MRFLKFCLLSTFLFSLRVEACTSIVVGKRATVDGSAMVTHNNDCTDCDIRIAVVPGGHHNESDVHNVYSCKFTYPRHIGYDRGSVYFPEKLEKYPVIDKTTFKPILSLPQPSFTYSYIDGTYSISNEVGLSMGESTCSAKLIAYGPPLGDAKFEVAELMRIAMARCDSSICAIELMGSLAEKYGYYGGSIFYLINIFSQRSS